MSAGLICEGPKCSTVLNLDTEEADIERAAWLVIRVQPDSAEFDCCSRSCAVELLESEGFVHVMDSYAARIAEIVHTIRDANEDDEDEDESA